MLDFEAVEWAFIERLTEQVGEYPTQPFPRTNSTGELPPLKHDVAEILVRWLGDSLPAPQPNSKGVIVQLAAEQFETFIRYRNHGATDKMPYAGAYRIVAKVTTALKGYSVPGVPDGSVLYPVRRQFVGEVEGIWNYSLVWQFTAPEVSD